LEDIAKEAVAVRAVFFLSSLSLWQLERDRAIMRTLAT
jgi:hypothetical protein